MIYDKLKLFHIVATHESFSSAAKKVRRTQSAVSQQIGLLEEDLGFLLFERKRNRAILSPQGKALLAVLADTFDRIDSQVIALRADLGKVEGRIRLGFLTDHSTSFDLANALVGFSEKYPKVDFSVSMGTNQEIEGKLANGNIDLGILVVFERPTFFHRKHIAQSRHLLVCGGALHDRISNYSLRKVIEQTRLVDFSEDFLCLLPWIKKNSPDLVSVLKQKRPSAIVPNHEEALKIVLKQWAIAVIPDHLCADYIMSGELRKVRPNALDLDVGLDIAYLKGRTLRQPEQLFVDFVGRKSA